MRLVGSMCAHLEVWSAVLAGRIFFAKGLSSHGWASARATSSSVSGPVPCVWIIT